MTYCLWVGVVLRRGCRRPSAARHEILARRGLQLQAGWGPDVAPISSPLLVQNKLLEYTGFQGRSERSDGLAVIESL
jgi:hypothetical protein